MNVGVKERMKVGKVCRVQQLVVSRGFGSASSFLVPSPNLVNLQNVGQFSHNSAERNACAQSRRDEGKGNLGSRNKRAGTFFSRQAWACRVRSSSQAWAVWTFS